MNQTPDHGNAASRLLGIAEPCMAIGLLVTLLNPALILQGAPAFEVPWATWAWLLVAGCVLAAALLVLPASSGQRLHGPWLAVLRAAFTVLIIITVFYPEGGRRLDGVAAEGPDATFLAWFYGCAAAGWVVLTVVFLFQRDLAKSLFRLLAGIGAAVVGYTIIVQPTTDPTRLAERADLSLGQQGNVIVIVADMLQGSTLEQYFLAHPETQAPWQGFTFHTRAVSPFPFTNYGLPAILSGKLYAADRELGYLDNLDAARNASFVTAARDAGWDTVVVGLTELQMDRDQYNYPQDSGPDYTAATLVDVGLTRLTKQTALLSDVSPGAKLMIALKRGSFDLFNRLMEGGSGPAERKLSLLHNFIPHTPAYYRPEHLSQPKVGWAPEPLTLDNFIADLAFFVGHTGQVLEWLKREGFYDDALIIVTGDHGHFIGAQRDPYTGLPGADDFAGWERGDWGRAAAMYNPAILVKPPRATGALRMTHDPASVLQVHGLVSAHLAGQSVDPTAHFASAHPDRQTIIVFPPKPEASPYTSTKSHVPLRISGNVSTLPDALLETPVGGRPDIAPWTPLAPPIEWMDGNWSRETQGAWLLDHTGRIRGPWAGGAEDTDLVLRIVGSPLKSKQHPEQRLDVALNGTPIGQMAFDAGRQARFLPVPQDVMPAAGEELVISLTPLDARTPYELGLWQTTEPVSVYVRELSFDSAEMGKYTPGRPLSPPNDFMQGDWIREPKGAWLMGETASIELPIQDFGKGRHALHLVASPLTSDSHVQQRVRIRVNGIEVAESTWTSPKQRQVFGLPDSLFAGAPDVLRIEFEPLDAKSPAELGKWATEVPLSIYLYELKVAAAR